MQKTVLANVSNSFFVRNFLRTGALAPVKDAGIRLVLCAPQEKLDYYRSEFSDPQIIFDALPPVGKTKKNRFWKLLETSSIATRTALMLQMADLLRPGSAQSIIARLGIFLFRRAISIPGRFAWWRELLRRLYFAADDPAYEGLLDKYRPDLVFCPSMIYMEDYVLAKAAKKRGIPVAGMTLSWDNFYSKTLLLVKPERLLAHTDFIKKQAARFGDYPEDKTTVVGIPQYDSHFLGQRVMPREEFMRRLGGDPAKKLILYALSGKAGLPIELGMLKILADLVKSGKLGLPVEVLARPYPRYDFPPDTLEEIRRSYGFLVQGSVAHVKGANTDWEFDEEALTLLASSLAHADVIINMYSTFLIEGAIWNKPLIAPAFDPVRRHPDSNRDADSLKANRTSNGTKKRNYWNSARRFFDWNHLADIKPLGGIEIVRSERELLEALNDGLLRPGRLKEGRERIVNRQCQFTDGCSGKRVAEALLSILK